MPVVKGKGGGGGDGSGGGGGGASGTTSVRQGPRVTTLFDDDQTLTTGFAKLGTGFDVPASGYVSIYVQVLDGPSNREGAVAYAEFPVERLSSASKGIGNSSSADDDDQRTVPLGANRYVSFAVNEAADDSHLMVAAQDSSSDGDYYLCVKHIEYGSVLSLGAVPGFTSPKDVYTADDEGLFLIDHGVLLQVEPDIHTGHGKLVGGTGSPGTWVEIPDADEGGGAGQHFRGWHSSSVVSFNPAVVSGDFFANETFSGFERYWDGTEADNPDGFVGFANYVPFAEGEYWATVDDGDGNAIDTSGGFVIADSELNAFVRAQDAGDVFVIRGQPRILIAETVQAPASTRTDYKPRLYVPQAGPVGMVAFWGAGQSEARPAEAYDRTLVNNEFYRYTFVGEDPDDVIFGVDFGVRCVAAADVPTTAGVMTGETIGDQQIFSFPAGKYIVELFDQTRVDQDTGLYIWGYCLKSGADEQVLQASSGESGANFSDPLGVVDAAEEGRQSIYGKVVLTLDTDSHLTFIGGPFDSAAEGAGNHVLYVTKVA